MDDFMKYKYGWEKFHSAVLLLASEGHLEKRLSDAFAFNISHLKKVNDIPRPLWERFDELVALLTSSDPEGDEGRINASVSKLDEMQKHQAVDLFVGLYDDLCRFMPNLYRR